MQGSDDSPAVYSTFNPNRTRNRDTVTVDLRWTLSLGQQGHQVMRESHRRSVVF